MTLRKLLTLLLRQNDPTWWYLEVLGGDNPDTARAFMYTYPEIVRMIRYNLNRVEANHAESIATNTLSPRDREGPDPLWKP